jgi:hypothetical protein
MVALADCTMGLKSLSERLHTAVALVPSADNATWGKEAFWPGADRSTAGDDQVAVEPVMVALTDCTVLLLSERVHTAVALVPSADNATCGVTASWPGADRFVTVDHVAVEPVMVALADCTMSLLPSKRVHTAVALVPSADNATSGLEAPWPGADRLTAGDDHVAVSTAAAGEATAPTQTAEANNNPGSAAAHKRLDGPIRLDGIIYCSQGLM